MTGAPKARVHVLAADDRVIQGARALDSDRFDVSFSRTPAEAFSATAAGAEVFITELRLNGFSVVREIRERTSTANVKVIMLPDRAHDRWLCEQAGADVVIVKPLPDTSTLQRAVDGLLEPMKAD